MAYIVIDKETGKEITDNVQVVKDRNDSYMYCRMKADKMLKQSDDFYENQIQPKYNEILKCSMDDFGPDFDPTRHIRWAAHLENLRSEIEQLEKEHRAMLDIAGDWEDREFAARFMPVVNSLAAGDKNPLRYRVFKLNLLKQMVEEYGCPSLGKYLV